MARKVLLAEHFFYIPWPFAACTAASSSCSIFSIEASCSSTNLEPNFWIVVSQIYRATPLHAVHRPPVVSFVPLTDRFPIISMISEVSGSTSFWTNISISANIFVLPRFFERSFRFSKCVKERALQVLAACRLPFLRLFLRFSKHSRDRIFQLGMCVCTLVCALCMFSKKGFVSIQQKLAIKHPGPPTFRTSGRQLMNC
jgi:hypothetical protein